MAGTTGLEPATSDVTGRRSNQLNYVPALLRLLQTTTACGRSATRCSRKNTYAILNSGGCLRCQSVAS